MSYFVRLSYSAKQLDGWLRLIADRCSSVVAYEHSDNDLNIHIHALLKDCKVSTDTLKNWVRKEIGCKTIPKTKWSFKEAVNDNCITYMSKGKLEPIFVHNYSQELIEGYKTKWDNDMIRKSQQQTIPKMFMVKESAKESKLRQNEMIDEIVKRLDQKDDWTPQNILSLIRQVVIIEQKTIVGRYKVRDYYDTIRARKDPATWLTNMMHLVRDKEIF